MATLAEVRARIDDWLAARWAVVVTRQSAYFNGHGRYWQGLRTHTIPPRHTASVSDDISPDRMSVTPTDQLMSWRDVLPEFEVSIPMALVMDVYESPEGHGWLATVYVYYGGTLYCRIAGQGPLSPDLHRDWHTIRVDVL